MIYIHILDNLSDDVYFLWENYHAVARDLCKDMGQEFQEAFLKAFNILLKKGAISVFSGDILENDLVRCRFDELGINLEDCLKQGYRLDGNDIVFSCEMSPESIKNIIEKMP